MYCGNCLRDNALVGALRKRGHDALMVPLYLPLTLDEKDESAGLPIFYGGINVYLAQKSALFRGSPGWLRDVLSSRAVLRWAAGKAAGTRAEDLGEVTLSMLRGEEGHQARELAELIAWLKTRPAPDFICLSNALLIGMARRLRSEIGCPVACMLQGEDGFLDLLPDSHREDCWQTLAERAAELDLFISPSRYFANVMTRRLSLRPERVKVVFNGLNLDGYAGAGNAAAKTGEPPVLGFFARMCREKGLDTLVDAFLQLRQGGSELRLRVGGSCGPADQRFVDSLRARIETAGLSGEVEFHPNVDRAAKISFLRSLDLFSVPAAYGEAFGLYVIEAMAAGVPVVQPRAGAFAELVEATGGGLVSEPGAKPLAAAIQELLDDPARRKALGAAGRRAVFERFTAERMAVEMERALQAVEG
jgi:glycosyltransferase involved in cell wall biosynthesis